MQRYTEIAGRFGIGYFIALGILTLTNRFANLPATFEEATVIAALGGLVGAAAATRR